MKYTVQRPFIVWVETVIDEADNLEEALEQADEKLKDGDYIELHQTFSIDYDRYWVQDATGAVKYV
jgi:hypothetical protein